ncbi:hypothetical protein ABEW19_12935 [Paenibacillus illinoisensis]|uniref:hypothetical protein n=2 Tax=Paenibacillus TaxID=44249 RepID=UPI003D27185E
MTGLFLFGCGFGAAEVGLNMEGSAVEKALNKVLLPAFHGLFSAGTLAGAAIGIGAEAIGLPIIVGVLRIPYICPIRTGKQSIYCVNYRRFSRAR